MMSAAVSDFATKAAALKAAIADLKANTTQENLDKAKAAWVATREPWEQNEAFLIGPVEDNGYDAGVDSWRALPPILTERVAHFFEHYKDLEKGKRTNIVRWADVEETAQIIREAIDRAKGQAPKLLSA